jgi:phage baseplate assembly protein W
MAESPHFDRPFRLAGSSFAVVEQDSDEELTNCAWAIVSTEIGSRDETPDFGVPDLPFRDPEYVSSTLVSAVRQWEPRLNAEAEASIQEMIMTANLEVE